MQFHLVQFLILISCYTFDTVILLINFQNRPLVLCLTATLTEMCEKETIWDLGLDPSDMLSISKNPVNRRISLINLPGSLDINPLLSMLEGPEDQCPRVIIFENSLVDCGYRYLEFKQVNYDCSTTHILETLKRTHISER